MAWALSFHILSAIGWLYIAPSLIALVARLAPRSVKATGISAYYFSVFVGATVSGSLGKLYGVIPNWQFWGLHAGFAVACGAAVLALMIPMNRVMAKIAANAPA